jgi:uncharacterized protein with HEPN domain
MSQSHELLSDVQKYSRIILGIADSPNWSFARADEIHRLAIERSFEILGVALPRLEREDSSLVETISEHRAIVGFRNRIAHGYDQDLDADVFDLVVRRHLPILLSEVDALIASLNA